MESQSTREDLRILPGFLGWDQRKTETRLMGLLLFRGHIVLHGGVHDLEVCKDVPGEEFRLQMVELVRADRTLKKHGTQ